MYKCFRIIYRYSTDEIELMSLINLYLTVVNGEDKRGRNHGLNHSEFKKMMKKANDLGGATVIFQKIKTIGRLFNWLITQDYHLEEILRYLEKRDWKIVQPACEFGKTIHEAEQKAKQHGSEYKIEPYVLYI